ncbi:MAG: EAL domain-containing protein [Actinomycetota bacterium]|nr:EAL domain-containing protein [Actinomycetota bacterium]
MSEPRATREAEGGGEGIGVRGLAASATNGATNGAGASAANGATNGVGASVTNGAGALAGAMPGGRGAPETWERRFRDVLELSRDAFIETDSAGVVTEWNHQAEMLLGWSRDDAIGRDITSFLIPERFARRFESDLAEARTMPPGAARASGERQLVLLHREGHEVRVSGVPYVFGCNESFRLGGFVHDVAAEQEAEEALAHAYLHDPLTGLPNRTLFTYRLSYVLARGHAEPGTVAVAVLDLDRFKAINDGLGHEVGDEVLVAVAERLRQADGTAEVIARLGGDEFLVLFDGADAQSAAVAFADKVAEALQMPIAAGGSEVFISASIGIASSTESVTEATALLSNADAAMYQAKQHGGASNRVFGDAMRVKVLDRMTTEHSLHRALERCELTLFYQPVVDICGERAVGVEALIRWQHPEQGLVAPDRFIPVAEETGLIIPIGTWVLHEACHQLKTWQHHRWGGKDGAVEVNLSARQIDHPEIVETVERILSDTGLAPANLTLEITESALMADAASALDVLSALKSLGVTLAIDDFGTGYSSLSYLQRFPLDILKVDKSFVDGLGSGEGSEIVAAVINLAHTLGLRVIAEGVETEIQLEELQKLDCDFAQGYLFSRPVPAADLVTNFPLRLGA